MALFCSILHTLPLQIFMTVIINGGSTGWLLKKLKLTETDRLDSIRDTRAQEGSLSSSPIALHAHTNPVFAKGAGMEMEMGHYPGSPTSSQLMHPPHSPSSPTPATHQHKTPQVTWRMNACLSQTFNVHLCASVRSASLMHRSTAHDECTETRDPALTHTRRSCRMSCTSSRPGRGSRQGDQGALRGCTAMISGCTTR